jgi:hypothetical protein
MNQVVVCTTPTSSTVELLVDARPPCPRQHEPVSCGIPLPRGVVRNTNALYLSDAQGGPVPLQTRILDRWPDHSLRWVLLDWQATVAGTTLFRLDIQPRHNSQNTEVPGILITRKTDHLALDTGRAQFELHTKGVFPFAAVQSGERELLDAARSRFVAEDKAGRIYTPRIQHVNLEEAGPLRASVRVTGDLLAGDHTTLCDFSAFLHFFAGSSTVRFSITLRNSRRALHPGGLWDLGDPGSIYLRDAALTLVLDGLDRSVLSCAPEPDLPFQPYSLPFELYQDSSGGANWRSSNHVNRHRAVPNALCGYRLRAGTSEHTGRRATPIVQLQRGSARLAVAVEHFWQNFPKAIEATDDSLTIRLFPRQYADVHELQAGEQKTHTFHVAFGTDTVTAEPLAWCRQPLEPRATPEWYSACAAVPYLTPKATDTNDVYLRLVDAAIDGDDTFNDKREVIDEYGWRHFGDIYGDHEAVRHKGPTPLVSHYNNQYDPLAGFAIQFLRSGDRRWWQHMAELAAHVIDIDIYHTDSDRSAYNHGLFWHTYHYVDADTATHRTYPRAGNVCGGGPANEQNYTTGLMLYYFLTGATQAREAALELARWVIDMDDGSKSAFRWLARSATGWASSSRAPHYHGPGRGAGNSIAVLLDGHRLTQDPIFLDKAEQLIRRCIHPSDDVAGRNLLEVENRWFYTMFLQSLGRYLDYQAEHGRLGATYAYARASLLHYARWMAEHEVPYLDRPQLLEYPTETWAAQDMRKSEVFKYAAKHASGPERGCFLERAEFFFRYSTTTLAGMKTRTLARPVVILLSYGYMHACFQRYPALAAPEPEATASDFGQPEIFVPQKARAKRRLRVLAASALTVVVVALLYWFLSR